MKKITKAIAPNDYRHKALKVHFDGGFGYFAESHLKNAQRLIKHPTVSQSKDAFDWLSLGSLLRHCIELYLKSQIIILTRACEEIGCTDIQQLLTQVKCHSARLDSTHNLGTLYECWSTKLSNSSSYLNDCTEYQNWCLPEEDESKVIREVAALDIKGDFFRYPVSRSSANDDSKSSWILVDNWWVNDPGNAIPTLVDKYLVVAEIFQRFDRLMRTYLTRGN